MMKQMGGMMGLPGGRRKATKSPKNKRKGTKGGGRPRVGGPAGGFPGGGSRACRKLPPGMDPGAPAGPAARLQAAEARLRQAHEAARRQVSPAGPP